MSQEFSEFPSPEEQAEAIFKEALVNSDANGDDCPLGEDCPLHFRNDEEILDDEEEAGRMVTYLGEWCIITSDNPELDSPAVLLRALLAATEGKEVLLPDFYETVVFKVGEGAYADLRGLDEAGQKDCVRFKQTFNEWSQFKASHEMIVDSIERGLLDLSKAVG